MKKTLTLIVAAMFVMSTAAFANDAAEGHVKKGKKAAHAKKKMKKGKAAPKAADAKEAAPAAHDGAPAQDMTGEHQE